MSNAFIDAVKHRRSIYAISKESPISDEKIQELIQDAVKHTPSSFNSQSSRVVLLLGEQHDRLWDMTEGILRKIVNNDEAFASTAQKMEAFRAGYGTVLFFEDTSVVAGFQQQYASYADNFPIWSEQSSGMLQYVVWTALELEGFGASLQHYNPIIDEAIVSEWAVPENWRLRAQMPFGKVAAPAGEKQFQKIEERVKVFK